MKRFFLRYGTFLIAGFSIAISAITIENEAEIIVWALASIGIVIIVFVLEQLKQKRKITQLKSDKLETELAFLKSQVSPHFFFNTLNNLYSLSLAKSDEAPKMILKLSQLMRYTIYSSRTKYVKLSQEIEHIENYIDLYKIRLRDKKGIHFSKTVNNPDRKVAPLLFIILVENAFKHGTETLGAKADVHITINEHPDAIYFEVINNFDYEVLPGQEGIGLDNLKKRLSHIYPKSHELSIEKEESKFSASIRLKK